MGHSVFWVLWAFVVAASSTASAFSAQLSRPWEETSSSSGSSGFCCVTHRKPIRGGRWRLPNPDQDVILVLLGAANGDEGPDWIEDSSIDGGETPTNCKKISLNELTASAESSHSEGDSVWKSRGLLWQMTRPSSIPGIALFHMLGVYLVLGETGQVSQYWKILAKPVMWLTLLAVNLVSATSMVVNDYYDAKLGRDALKDSDKVLLRQDGLTKATAKRFLMYLYATALFIAAVLPGIPTRLSVTTALMMTYLYTKHLKPMTWVKNIVCASLIALAPWTSGSCALHLLKHTDSTSRILVVPALWRLFGVLFTGVLGREVLMDCNDVVADDGAGIRTVPVVHGRLFATKVAGASSIGMACLAVAPHAYQIITQGVSTGPLRRLLLAGIASGIQLRRNWQVWRTKGEDAPLISKAIDESLFTVVFLLASFV